MSHAFFVTGTDTDAGKTLITAALIECANHAGYKTLGLKPLAAGGVQTPDGIRNEDALQLQQVASLKLPYRQVNPVLLNDAMAPHIAAAREKKRLSVESLVGYTRGAMMPSPKGGKADVCFIEGAGGWRVPLSPNQTTADFAKTLGLPVIIVIGLKLGCLNHALLTLEAVQRDGLRVAGWAATQVDPDMSVVQENLDTLKALLPDAYLGFVPWLDHATPALAAEYLQFDVLIPGAAAE
ncbi:dethiobiotin synthase [Teredinibacter purpureus]|uniref:dethiobiotin synthase n=1 Tax=Teredinibacter purpureus TaxID=2731756 RepID=UPI0005F89008|nr:dethiobiotin synthase [Teredinibacter purpureus]